MSVNVTLDNGNDWESAIFSNAVAKSEGALEIVFNINSNFQLKILSKMIEILSFSFDYVSMRMFT